MEPPEIEAHAAHKPTGRRWLDMAVSLAALVTSIASITMAFHNGQSMDRLVTANSWPFPILENSNFIAGESRIELAVRNSGSGPAKLETVTMFYQGKAMANWRDLMRACCLAPGAEASDDLIQNQTGYMLSDTPTGSVLLPGEQVLLMSLARSDANLAAWDALNAVRFELTFEACYCSVFDDCWTTNLQTTRPKPVAQCPARDDVFRG
ncbi:MAG: hypothetical protein NW200_04885 [Hyphomonadaceae bacterium]|nr:hypothetical protein [Hyphomonadaceae bacterium]